MINQLPPSLLEAARKVIETTDGIQEDEVTAMDVPKGDEPEAELSGKKEEVEINPEYKTFTSRRPQ